MAGLLLLVSAAFVVGGPVGLSLPWLLVAVGIAIVAGAVTAGSVPTVGSLWLVGCWWFAFPPLVGYLGGGWPAPRYHHPRMQGFAYGAARAELVGGLEYGLTYGLLLALVLGTVGYAVGAVLRWLGARLAESG